MKNYSKAVMLIMILCSQIRSVGENSQYSGESMPINENNTNDEQELLRQQEEVANKLNSIRENKLLELENDNMELENENIFQKEIIENLKKELRSRNEEIVKENERIYSLIDENKKEKVKEALRLIEISTKEREEHKEEREKKLESITRMNKEIENIKDSEVEISEKANKVVEIKTEICNLVNELNKLEVDKKKHNEIRKEKEKESKEKIAKLEKEGKELQSELKEIKIEELNKIISKIKVESEELILESESKETKISKLNNEISKLRTELGKLEDSMINIIDMKNNIEGKNEYILILEEKIKITNIEIKELEEKIEEKDMKIENLEKEKKEIINKAESEYIINSNKELMVLDLEEKLKRSEIEKEEVGLWKNIEFLREQARRRDVKEKYSRTTKSIKAAKERINSLSENRNEENSASKVNPITQLKNDLANMKEANSIFREYVKDVDLSELDRLAEELELNKYRDSDDEYDGRANDKADTVSINYYELKKYRNLKKRKTLLSNLNHNDIHKYRSDVAQIEKEEIDEAEFLELINTLGPSVGVTTALIQRGLSWVSKLNGENIEIINNKVEIEEEIKRVNIKKEEKDEYERELRAQRSENRNEASSSSQVNPVTQLENELLTMKEANSILRKYIKDIDIPNNDESLARNQVCHSDASSTVRRKTEVLEIENAKAKKYRHFKNRKELLLHLNSNNMQEARDMEIGEVCIGNINFQSINPVELQTENSLSLTDYSISHDSEYPIEEVDHGNNEITSEICEKNTKIYEFIMKKNATRDNDVSYTKPSVFSHRLRRPNSLDGIRNNVDVNRAQSWNRSIINDYRSKEMRELKYNLMKKQLEIMKKNLFFFTRNYGIGSNFSDEMIPAFEDVRMEMYEAAGITRKNIEEAKNLTLDDEIHNKITKIDDKIEEMKNHSDIDYDRYSIFSIEELIFPPSPRNTGDSEHEERENHIKYLEKKAKRYEVRELKYNLMKKQLKTMKRNFSLQENNGINSNLSDEIDKLYRRYLESVGGQNSIEGIEKSKANGSHVYKLQEMMKGMNSLYEYSHNVEVARSIQSLSDFDYNNENHIDRLQEKIDKAYKYYFEIKKEELPSNDVSLIEKMDKIHEAVNELYEYKNCSPLDSPVSSLIINSFASEISSPISSTRMRECALRAGVPYGNESLGRNIE